MATDGHDGRLLMRLPRHTDSIPGAQKDIDISFWNHAERGLVRW